MKKVLQFGLVLAIAAWVLGCSQIKTIPCPTGEPIVVVQNINNAFPVYASAYQGAFDLSVNVLDKIEGKVSGEFKKEIQKFREDLNNVSSRLQDRLKTALLGLQTTPCDMEARKNFWSIMHIINDKADSLEKMIAKLEQTAKAGQGFAPIESSIQQIITDTSNSLKAGL